VKKQRSIPHIEGNAEGLSNLVLHFLFYSYDPCSYNPYIIQHTHCVSQSACVPWCIVLHCLGVTMMGLFH